MFRKLNKQSLIILILALVCLICAIVTDVKIFRHPSRLSINGERIGKELIKKDKELNAIIDEISGNLKNSQVSVLLKEKPIEVSDMLSAKGMALFIYENDSLKFWSDNTVPVINKYSGSTFSNNIVQLKNGWFKSSHRIIDNKIIVGLILIKSMYQYENDFLQNNFNPDLLIPQECSITTDTLKEGFKIKDARNNYLFTLTTPTEKIASDSALYFSLTTYILGIILLLVFILKHFTGIIFKKISWVWLLSIGAGLFLLRYAMITFGEPSTLYSFKLFDPQNYAHSFFYPSLGDFLLNTIFIFFFSYLVYKANLTSAKYTRSSKLSILILAGYLIASCGLFAFNHYMLNSLVFNSSISFDVYKVFGISAFSLIGFFIIAFMFASFVIITDKFILLTIHVIPYKKFLIILGVFSLAAIPFFYYYISIGALIFFVAVTYILSYIRYKHYSYNYYLLLLIIFIASVYIVSFITYYSFQKEREIRKVLVVNLANERDMVAEILLQEMNNKLIDDKAIKHFIHYPYANLESMTNYIQNEYFKGYWNKYDFKIYACSVQDSLFIEPDYKLSHCFSFFGDLIGKFGVSIPKTNFYFLDNVNGKINYLGVLKFKSYSTNQRVTLYIDLASKLTTEDLGYPELLLDKKIYQNSTLAQYSYAKYRNNQLLTQVGEYRYSIGMDLYAEKGEEFSFISLDGYSHVIYSADANNVIILSKPELKTIDVLISLSYIFVFFFLLANIILLGRNFPQGFRKFQFNMQTRIQFFMIALLMLSLIFIGGGTIYYNAKQYNKKNLEHISEKTQSVLKELELHFGKEFEFTSKNKETLSQVLTKLSSIFYTDINLYDTKGNLLATSRPEIFEKGLVGVKMHSNAYRMLFIYKKSELVHSESIGKLQFLSAYVPFKNNNGRVLAYLNLPYFTKQSALKNEISSFVVAIINAYVILILISILITLFISRKLTQPLSVIQRKLRETSLSRKNEQIHYEGKDEIGNLIKEYNRMVEELAESAELLAKSERESAWREMAKQIAHEIKNPLTPMKLSVQHLQRAWHDNKPDREALLEKVTKTLIEQIDALSAIATEFSSFAKMPKASIEKLNLANIISNSVQLFLGMNNLQISVDNEALKNVTIFADKEQMLRVFNNLVKNAIQAHNENTVGTIKISAKTSSKFVIISITDNGSGIPPEMQGKIFQPNFTTKSSGMGLGLSIVKNIVENSGGKIWFDTEPGFGTTFFVELPLYQSSN